MQWRRWWNKRQWRADNPETVQLPRPYTVHLLYWTAWAEPDGTIHFRDDI